MLWFQISRFLFFGNLLSRYVDLFFNAIVICLNYIKERKKLIEFESLLPKVVPKPNFGFGSNENWKIFTYIVNN